MARITLERKRVLLSSLFVMLSEHPDGLQVRVALQRLKETVGPTEYELERLKSGPRFDSVVKSESTYCVKAEWLVKRLGVWTLTREGLDAFRDNPNPTALWEARQEKTAKVEKQPSQVEKQPSQVKKQPPKEKKKRPKVKKKPPKGKKIRPQGKRQSPQTKKPPVDVEIPTHDESFLSMQDVSKRLSEFQDEILKQIEELRLECAKASEPEDKCHEQSSCADIYRDVSQFKRRAKNRKTAADRVLAASILIAVALAGMYYPTVFYQGLQSELAEVLRERQVAKPILVHPVSGSASVAADPSDTEFSE